MSTNELPLPGPLEDNVDLLDMLFTQLQICTFELLEFFPSFHLEDKRQLNLLLLGKTGYGKSATGNTGLGRKEFESKACTTSVTSEVKCGQVVCGDYLVNIIDTPGFADTSDSGENIDDKISVLEKTIENMDKAVGMCHEGIHALIFVVKFSSRFTEEDRTVLQYLRQIFGNDFLAKHGIILFTHGDMFELAMEDEESPHKFFETWCSEQKGTLGELMNQCDYRCVLFDNRCKNEQQRQFQMEYMVHLAELVPRTYQQTDYRIFEDSRQRMIFDLKVPKLRDEFQLEISSLKWEIECTCKSEIMTGAEFEYLNSLTENLEAKIISEDRNSGMLYDLVEDVVLARKDVCEHKARCDEAQRRKESNCSIS